MCFHFAYEGDTAKLKLVLWNNSGGIGAITQLTLRSLLHVMANPVWGVKTAYESPVFGFIMSHQDPYPPKHGPHIRSLYFLPPLKCLHRPCYTSLKSSIFGLIFKGIKRYASNHTKSTPMFDFFVPQSRSSTSEMQLNVVEWSFSSLSPPNYCFKASSCLNVL